MVTRRQVLTWFGGLLAVTSGYAGAIEPGLRFRVQNWQIQPPRWPRGLKLRIVALADPHLAEPHMPLARFERIVERANRLGGDLIVLLGDYPAGHRFVTQAVAPLEAALVMSRLRAPLGIFAILGNHDWWEDPLAQDRQGGPTVWHEAFAQTGIPLLENSAVKLSHAGQSFWLAGMGDPIAFLRNKSRTGPRGVDDFPAMMAQITGDDPAILLLHEPDFWPQWRERFALGLAGHTHGGQIRLMGWSPVVPSMYGNRYAYGPVVEDDRILVVSGGLGCSILPVRLGMPPEITVIDLN